MKLGKILKCNMASIIMLVILAALTACWAFNGLGIPQKFSPDNASIFSWDSWDNFITVLTFIVAMAIGWQGLVRRWEDKLPNKLTVHFVYGNDYIMSCYNVSLASEKDIRAWGQQVGAQMVGGKRLDMKLTNSQQYMGIVGDKFKHYEAVFYLSEEPKIFQKSEYKNKYLTWFIEGNDNGEKGVLIKKINERRENALSFEEAKANGQPWIDVKQDKTTISNKLTAHFVYKDQYLLSCYNLNLLSESDLSCKMQEIVTYMTDDKNVKLGLITKQIEHKLENNIKHFEIISYLSEEPKILSQDKYKDKYIIWIADGDDFIKKVHEKRLSSSMPLSEEEAREWGELLDNTVEKSSQKETKKIT